MAQTNRIAFEGVSPGAGSLQAARIALRRLASDDSGQDLIEYALIASFIGLSSIAGIHGIASKIASFMNLVLQGFDAATAPHS